MQIIAIFAVLMYTFFLINYCRTEQLYQIFFPYGIFEVERKFSKIKFCKMAPTKLQESLQSF